MKQIEHSFPAKQTNRTKGKLRHELFVTNRKIVRDNTANETVNAKQLQLFP